MSNNPYLSSNFVKALNYYQVVAGKTKKEVAEAIGVPPTTYSSWSNGKHLPDMDKLQALSIYLHVPITEFFEFTLGTQQRDPLMEEITDLCSRLPQEDKLLIRSILVRALQLNQKSKGL